MPWADIVPMHMTCPSNILVRILEVSAPGEAGTCGQLGGRGAILLGVVTRHR